MKKICLFLLMISACLLTAAGAFAQSAEMTPVGEVSLESPASRMLWDGTGEWLTVVSRDQYLRFHVESDKKALSNGSFFDPGTKAVIMSAAGDSGVAAALSDDWRTIFVYEDTGNSEKAVKTIEPGFMMLSVSVSNDGSMVLADSAEEIRTVVYSTADGEKIYDLGGFSTAAPVYDSTLSRDGSRIIWHSRGTFAVQDAETGDLGETVSLWDFASSYDLAPDNSVLAVGIINDDYESGAVLFFDPQTGAEAGRTVFGKTAPQELSYSADGSVLMAADNGTLYRIDPKNFELLDQVTIVSGDAEDVRISRIALSPDGTSCAVLLNDGKVYIVKN